MNTRALLLGTALLAPLLFSSSSASSAPATRIKFGPADGTSLTKTFETKAQLTLDNYSMTGAGMQPKIEMTVTTGQKIVVTDDYVKIKDGKPQKLKRSFEDLTSDSSMSTKTEMMGQSQAHDMSTQSETELEGKKVLFTWDSDKGEFKKAFDPAQSKDEVLAGLTEDMDLRCVLPESEVKEGDEWDVPLKELRNVLMPGGDMAFKPKNSEDQAKMGLDSSSMTQAISDKLEGTAKAKLSALKEVDGVKVAVIHLDLKIHSKADMTDAAQKMLKNGGVPKQVESLEIDHVDIDFHFEGEGDVVWDLGGGHFRSLELTGQQAIKTETGMTIGVQGRKLNITESKDLSGTASYSAKAK